MLNAVNGTTTSEDRHPDFEAGEPRGDLGPARGLSNTPANIAPVRSLIFLGILTAGSVIITVLTVRLAPERKTQGLLYAAFTALGIALTYVLLAGVHRTDGESDAVLDLFGDALVQSLPAVLVGLGATLLAVWAVLWGTDRNEKFNLALERQRRADDREEAVQDARYQSIAESRSYARDTLRRAKGESIRLLRYFDAMIDPPGEVVELANRYAELSHIRPLALHDMSVAEWSKEEGIDQSGEEYEKRRQLRRRLLDLEAAGQQISGELEIGLVENRLAWRYFEDFPFWFGSHSPTGASYPAIRRLLVALGARRNPNDWAKGLGISLVQGSEEQVARETDSYVRGLQTPGITLAVTERLVALSSLRDEAPFSEDPRLRRILDLKFTNAAEYDSRLKAFREPPVHLFVEDPIGQLSVARQQKRRLARLLSSIPEDLYGDQ